MGCTNETATIDTRPLGVRYAGMGLNQPFSVDYQNEFEKDLFFAINMLRFNPKSFVPHVQRVHTKGLNIMADGKQSKAMP